MLPLHGQSTAAVKKIHWAGPTPYYRTSRSHVFAKQAECIFAEFLFIISMLKICVNFNL